jgi:hypothetical protein
MGEGWSDYFAISIFDDPVLGEYGTQNPTSGIRRYAYDNNPLTYGDLCTGPAGCEVHDDGEIWGAVLWDLRDFYVSQLGPPAGSAAADELVVEALMLTPASPSVLNARDAILQAELAMGGVYQDNIWQVFANRGMGCSATSVGDSEFVTEAFDVCDTDGDGCTAAQEEYGASAPNPGSTCSSPSPCYSDSHWYDFYDVPVPARADPLVNGAKDKAINLGDVGAVLFYAGAGPSGGCGNNPNGNGVDYDCDKDGSGTADGVDYDRNSSPPANPPWEAGPPDNAVTLADVGAALAQAGLGCAP